MAAGSWVLASKQAVEWREAVWVADRGDEQCLGLRALRHSPAFLRRAACANDDERKKTPAADKVRSQEGTNEPGRTSSLRDAAGA